ncbi:2-dehydropantoate 2-reductase [Paracoccaceae bacterium]|nr:2-dehydropantoate 2-reductase [Paracoccaceae bacterium]
MKICIFGGGSIGGLLAVNLEKVGISVSVIARGQHLDVMKKNGLTLIDPLGEATTAIVNCTDEPDSLGVQDYLFLTIKSPALLPSLEAIKPLIGKHTTIITCMNGIPHWYFHKLDNKYSNYKIKCLDADLLIDTILPPDNIVGSVVYPACEILEPGTIKHIAGNRFSLGEPNGSESDRLKFISEILKKSGFRAPIQKNIRDEIWLKLIGNLSFNPISALTGATLEQICNDQGTVAIVREMMIEAKAIAEELGANINMSIEKRIDGARKVGAHKTSMLQDMEAGKPIEIDSIIIAVQELGELTGLHTPYIDTILNLTLQKARLVGCL